jgi:hypothetical protein
VPEFVEVKTGPVNAAVIKRFPSAALAIEIQLKLDAVLATQFWPGDPSKLSITAMAAEPIIFMSALSHAICLLHREIRSRCLG